MRVQRWRAPRKNEVSGFFERLLAQNAHEFGLLGCGGRRPGPLRSVTDRAPEFDDRSSLQQTTSPLGTLPCGLFLFSGSPGIKVPRNVRSYSYSYSMKWYSYSKGTPETLAVNFRQLMLSNASKIVFAPSRVKNSSTSRSTSTALLSTKKQETSDCPVNSQNSWKMKFLAFLEDWCAKPGPNTPLKSLGGGARAPHDRSPIVRLRSMTGLLSSKTQARLANRRAGFSCFRVLQVSKSPKMLVRTRTRTQ
jgi:hypothetical protein